MNFDEAVTFTLIEEGPQTIDSDGVTKFGILSKFHPQVLDPSFSIFDAKQIYKTEYWDKCRLDLMPSRLRLMVFECAVNQGVQTAIRTLQKTLSVKVDGIIGPKTLAAATDISSWDILTDYMVRRSILYAQLDKFPIYGLGWLRRLSRAYLITVLVEERPDDSVMGIIHEVNQPH